ncbi:transposase [bacterium]|nr:transposase [bacterium]
MPRKARDDFEGYWYHVMIRGQRKNPLFFSPTDKKYFLATLNELLNKYDVLLGAYALMNNHVHLLLFRRKDSLYKFMHRLNTKYAQHFNKVYKTVGYVFQGRFKSKIILNEGYLITVIEYIHNNPYKAGIVKKGEIYRYSSEAFYLNSKSSVKMARIKGINGNSSNQSLEEISHDNFIGNEEDYKNIDKRVRDNSKAKYIEKRNGKDIINIYDSLTGFSKHDLDEIRSSKRGKTVVMKRHELVQKLYEYNYSLSEIARFINKAPSTIFKIVDKYNGGK